MRRAGALLARVTCFGLVLLVLSPQVMAAATTDPATSGAGGMSDAQRAVFGLDSHFYNVASCGTSDATTTAALASPFATSYSDSSRNGRKVGVTIYAPSDTDPHPLVIFAPGQNQNSSSDFYRRYLQATADAGFIVAGADFSDNTSAAAIPNEAADISFLIGKVQQEPSVKGLINPAAAVGVIGHSDGAMAALLAAYGAGQGQQDDRIGAVIEQDGALPGAVKKGPALLIMHGSADTIEPPASASSVFNGITAPYKGFALFKGADHHSYITGQPSVQDGKSYDQFNAAVDTLTKAFLSRELNSTKNNGTSLGKIVAAQYPTQITFAQTGDEDTTPGQVATPAAQTSSSSCCSSTGDLSGGSLPASVPTPYNKIFTDAATLTGTDPLIIASIFLSEHGYSWPNPPPPYGTGPAWASSPAGASGPFQFLAVAWASNGAGGNIMDLKDAAAGAGRYILPLGGKPGIPLGSLATSMTTKPSVANVLGSYNAGSAGNFFNSETSGYITKGLQAYAKMQAGQDPTSGGTTGGVATPVVDTTPSSGCAGNAAVAGNIIQTAKNFAWDTDTGHTAFDSAKPEYKTAWAKYTNAPVGRADAQTDCSAFVATVLISAGIETDPQYPHAGTTAQEAWYRSHPDKYQIIEHPTSTAQLKPGDILIHDTPLPGGGSDGHTLIYIGDSTWQAADASLGGHTPQIQHAVTWMFPMANDIAVRVIGGANAAQSV
jgi:hypothetical protein